MGSYTPVVPHTVKFDGDTVTMDLRRLKRKDMMRLLPFMETNAEGDAVVSAAKQGELFDVMAGLLEEYVMNFRGLTTVDGSDISLTDALDEAYYIGLISMVIAKLIEISQFSEADEKNLHAQRGAARKG